MLIKITDKVTNNSSEIAGYNHIKIISPNGNTISLEEVNGDLIIRNN